MNYAAHMTMEYGYLYSATSLMLCSRTTLFLQTKTYQYIQKSHQRRRTIMIKQLVYRECSQTAFTAA